MDVRHFTTDISNIKMIQNDLEMISTETKYYCPFTNQQNDLDSYIYKLVQFHSKQKNIVLNDKNVIQYELICLNTNLQLEYIKQKKQSPLFTILFYVSNDNSQVLFTELDINEYKYKEFKSNNKICIYSPEKYVHTVFDSSKYYGMFNSKTHQILKINVWDIELCILQTILPNMISNGLIKIMKQVEEFEIIEKKHNIFKHEEIIYDTNVFESIIYNFNKI